MGKSPWLRKFGLRLLISNLISLWCSFRWFGACHMLGPWRLEGVLFRNFWVRRSFRQSTLTICRVRSIWRNPSTYIIRLPNSWRNSLIIRITPIFILLDISFCSIFAFGLQFETCSSGFLVLFLLAGSKRFFNRPFLCYHALYIFFYTLEPFFEYRLGLYIFGRSIGVLFIIYHRPTQGYPIKLDRNWKFMWEIINFSVAKICLYMPRWVFI